MGHSPSSGSEPSSGSRPATTRLRAGEPPFHPDGRGYPP